MKTITPTHLGYALLAIATVWLAWGIATGATHNLFAPVAVGIGFAAVVGFIWRCVSARRDRS